MSANSRVIRFGYYGHEEFEEGGKRKHRASCKFCPPDVPKLSEFKGTTSGFTRHLKRVHKARWEEYLSGKTFPENPQETLKRLLQPAAGCSSRSDRVSPIVKYKQTNTWEKQVAEALLGEEHYNCISALHKSMRGCDANASLYWLGRMLVGGEDPLYVAHRLIEFASVDVGLADPSALVQAVSTFHACQAIGMPVCEFNLAQCVIYLARAPKSPKVYLAYEKVKKCITEHKGPLPGVPLHLRNAPTKLMKSLGYGKRCNPAVRPVYMPEGLEDVCFLHN